MNFKDDVKQEIIRYFNSWNITYPLPPSVNNERQALIDFFNTNSKLIARKPRAVYKSDTFLNKLNGSGLETDLQYIEEKITRGDELNPHLSSRILRPSYDDDLLNAWNIYHFHISMVKDNPSDRFYKRADYLLFAMVMPGDIYFIDIRPHRENEVFVKQEFLETTVRNWPHLLEKADIIAMDRTHSDTEVQELRNIHVNITAHEINGKFYHPPGLGFTGNGRSAQAVIRTNDVLRWIMLTEKYLTNNNEKIKLDIARVSGQNIENPTYKLHIIAQAPGFTIIEEASGLRLEEIEPKCRIRFIV